MNHDDARRQSQIRGYKSEIVHHKMRIAELESAIDILEREDLVMSAWKKRTEDEVKRVSE